MNAELCISDDFVLAYFFLVIRSIHLNLMNEVMQAMNMLRSRLIWMFIN